MKPCLPFFRSALVFAAALGLGACAEVSNPRAEPPAPMASTGPAASQRTFASPEEALQALVTANKAGDLAAVDALFGPEVQQLKSGDPKQDALEFAAFAKLIVEYTRLVRKADDRYVINVGTQNWPLPIPLVRRNGGWFFDTIAGKEEVLNRRIGEDELTAIGVCRTYVAAQHEYAAVDRAGDGVLSYAQKLHSTEGGKDGLYWPVAANEDPSPFGPLISEAHAEGYGGRNAAGQPNPFHGYHFKVLTAQGPSAPGGAYSYIINGHLVAGFALVAYPADWGQSGVMTFIVNQWGKVYQRNLGPNSATLAAAMTTFDPDPEWTVVKTP